MNDITAKRPTTYQYVGAVFSDLVSDETVDPYDAFKPHRPGTFERMALVEWEREVALA